MTTVFAVGEDGGISATAEIEAGSSVEQTAFAEEQASPDGDAAQAPPTNSVNSDTETASSGESAPEESSSSAGSSSEESSSSAGSSSEESTSEARSSSEEMLPEEQVPDVGESSSGAAEIPPDSSADTSPDADGSEQLSYGVEIYWKTLEFDYAPDWNPETYCYDDWKSTENPITVKNTSNSSDPLQVKLTFISSGDVGITANFSPVDGDSAPENLKITDGQVVFLLPRSADGVAEATVNLSLSGKPVGLEGKEEYIQIGSIKTDITPIQAGSDGFRDSGAPPASESETAGEPKQTGKQEDTAGAPELPQDTASAPDVTEQFDFAAQSSGKESSAIPKSPEVRRPEGQFTNSGPPQEETT